MVRQLAGYDPAIDELPPELAAQYRAEQRKQRVADVLSGQALRPLQAPEVKGRFQGAVSPMAGLAQLAQAYLSSKMANDADARFADIGKRGRDAYSAEVKRVGETIMGRPDEVLPPDVAGPPQSGMPAGTPDQVAQALLSSYAPSLRRMGETAFKSNLDAQATMNLMKMFGQDNAPPPAVPAAAMPAAPTAPAGAPAVPRPEAAAWPPSAAMPGVAAQEELRQNPGLTPSRGPWNTYPDASGQQRILQAEAQDPAAAAETAALALRHPSGRGGRADPAVPAQANLDALPTTPTPLEAYTRRQRYSKREAQAMMVSGNKPVADIGKRIFDGYEKAEQETLIKQPGRETLAAFPVAPVKVEDPNRPGREVVVDARNNDRVIGSVVPKQQGAAAADKATQARKKTEGDLDTAIGELEKATKDGGLIDQSTGSGAGALVDRAAGFFGKATPGAIAAGRTAPIFDLVLKMVPRFEGPQSDKDTQSYKEAAGQLANPSVPNETKKQAGREILRLMKQRKGQFVDKAIEGTDADVPTAGAPAAPTAVSGGRTVLKFDAQGNPR